MSLLLAAGLVAAALPEADKPFYHEHQWVVMENTSNCILVGGYGNNSRLWVTYDFGLDRSIVIVTDKAFQSADATRNYDIDPLFARMGKIDRGWGTLRSQGIKLDDIGGVRFIVSGTDFINDLSRSDMFGLSLDHNIIASFKLTFSGSAVDQLKICAKNMHSINPSDPLAGKDNH